METEKEADGLSATDYIIELRPKAKSCIPVNTPRSMLAAGVEPLHWEEFTQEVETASRQAFAIWLEEVDTILSWETYWRTGVQGCCRKTADIVELLTCCARCPCKFPRTVEKGKLLHLAEKEAEARELWRPKIVALAKSFSDKHPRVNLTFKEVQMAKKPGSGNTLVANLVIFIDGKTHWAVRAHYSV